MVNRQVNSQEVQDRIDATLNEIIEAVKGKVHDAVESAVDNALSNINSYDIARDVSDELEVEFEVRRELQNMLVGNGDTPALSTLTGNLPIEVSPYAFVQRTYNDGNDNFFIDTELKGGKVKSWEDFFHFVVASTRDDVPAVKMMERLAVLRQVTKRIIAENDALHGGGNLYDHVYKN